VYPSPGLEFATGFGPSGWLDWDSGPIVGTIDSNGQVVLPNFGMRLWTDFSETGVPEQVGDVKASLQSGIQQRSVAGNPVLFFGEPVQADGTVRLVGTGLVTFQLALQTGTGLTCRLSPVPDLASLPKGPTLKSSKGKIKIGPDATAATSGDAHRHRRDRATALCLDGSDAAPAPGEFIRRGDERAGARRKFSVKGRS
jgi:hypothetical protein